VPLHVSLATAIDKGRLASTVVYLALLEIDVLDPTSRLVVETIRLAHNNENHEFRGETYIRMPFEFEVRRAKGEMPTISLTITDHSQAIQARLQESSGGVDFPVRLLIVSTANPDSPELVENFTILSATARSSDYAVTFEIGAENPLALRFPPRLMRRNRCEFRFRGPDCGYTGSAPTCDYSLDGPNGCAVKGNALNFGGFRGIRRLTWR
jgi:hypothetical protein